jgi:hypothetical protein
MLVVGKDICACQPAAFTLSLDLGGTCDSNDFNGKPGIEETVCAILDENDKLTERVPVSISKVQITEFDQTVENIKAQKTYNERNYTTGDAFEFTGFLADAGAITDAVAVPGSLLVELSGVDKDGNLVDNSWVIDFKNGCDVFPVIAAGQRLGWAVFVRVYWCIIDPETAFSWVMVVPLTTFHNISTAIGRSTRIQCLSGSPQRNPHVGTGRRDRTDYFGSSWYCANDVGYAIRLTLRCSFRRAF